MAKRIVDCTVSVNGVSLSTYVSSVDIDETADDHDVTGMTATAHEHLLGLSEDSITLNFWQDYAAAKVDATLQPLQGSNTAFPVVVVTASPDSKTYTMQSKLPNYKPLSGSVGEPNATECSFVCGDGVGVVVS